MAHRRSVARPVRLEDLQAGRGHLDAADDPGTGRGIAALWTRPAASAGGMRIACSYLVAFLGVAVGASLGWAVAARLYDSGTVCRGDESLSCPLIAMLLWMVPLAGGLLALGAWWFRLGWTWWLAGAALSCVLVEAVGDPTSPLLFALLLVPAAVALLTDPSARVWGRRRRLLTAGLAVAGLLQFAIVTWLAVRR